MFFTNLAHANEIHIYNDCANYTQTDPGVWYIMSALIVHNFLPWDIWWTFKGPLNFSEFFSQLKLSIIILTAVSNK